MLINESESPVLKPLFMVRPCLLNSLWLALYASSPAWNATPHKQSISLLKEFCTEWAHTRCGGACRSPPAVSVCTCFAAEEGDKLLLRGAIPATHYKCNSFPYELYIMGHPHYSQDHALHWLAMVKPANHITTSLSFPCNFPKVLTSKLPQQIVSAGCMQAAAQLPATCSQAC